MRGKSEVYELIKGTDFEQPGPVARGLLLPPHGSRAGPTKRPTRRIARVLEPLRDDYDWVFLDCPPSISLVSESVFEAADALLVPLIPATLSSRTFGQLTDVVREGPRVLAFFSMVDRRKRLHRDVMASMRAAHTSVLDAVIPAAADVERMGAAGPSSSSSRPADARRCL